MVSLAGLRLLHNEMDKLIINIRAPLTDRIIEWVKKYNNDVYCQEKKRKAHVLDGLHVQNLSNTEITP